MKKNYKFRFLSLIMALLFTITGLGGAVPAMAAEATTSNLESFDKIEEADMLRAEFDEIINQNNLQREYYKTDYWGYCEVTGQHYGSLHTIYGHYARLAVAFKPLDGNTAIVASLLCGFGSWTLYYSEDAADADGYYMFVSDWIPITYKGAYSLFYSLSTTGSSGYDPNNERTAAFHVWVDYK